MATHSNILAWRILWREEPGRLQSMGSQTVGHDWALSLSLSVSLHYSYWKSHGWSGLVGYSPWGCKRIGHNLVTKQKQQLTMLPHYLHLEKSTTPHNSLVLLLRVCENNCILPETWVYKHSCFSWSSCIFLSGSLQMEWTNVMRFWA